MNEKEIIDYWLNMEHQQPVQLATQDAYWQHYRIQASIAAMQGQLANDESVKQMIETLDCVALPDKTKAYMNLVARSSVMLADALIEELRKEANNDCQIG